MLSVVGAYFVQFLVGRCRLPLSREKLQDEGFFLGFRNGRKSRELRAADIAGLQIGDTERGGMQVRTTRGDTFFLKLPVGTGAFTMNDLMWLKHRWVDDLGWTSRPAPL